MNEGVETRALFIKIKKVATKIDRPQDKKEQFSKLRARTKSQQQQRKCK